MSSPDVWSIDARIDETLAGLGLPQLASAGRSRHLSSLSPGQRVRLELTALLVSRPDVLVLDEPTNHLDKDGSNFLVRMLMDWSGPVILASHDRAFINKVATVIYDLDIASWQALATASGLDAIPGAYRCQGNYSDYLVAKTQAREAHKQLHSSQQVEKRSIQAHRATSQNIAQGGSHMKTATGMARKFYSDRAASTAVRRIRNDDRRLDDLSNREVRKLRTYDLRLDFADAPAQTGVAVSARNATLPHRLQEVTFDLMHGEHLLITGPNGAGKSTLVNWIAAGTPPTTAHSDASGTITRDDRLVLIPQRLPQQGDPGFTETVWNEGIGQMGTGIIHPSMWNTPVPALSAGNQRRAQIAVAVAEQPAILLIDEPTNYLDLDTIEAFEDAISEWAGTLVIVSHDQWLIDKWRGKRLCLGSSA
ncbi:ATP-binding cassette domain-containing protein [Corynebacterium silvaticum]|uniref:ATP-binding cassette domain-containing protein n=2 Tax=Corynebacterium silvaticum TaxID=2320431 RepID=A0ACD4PXP2_9CORY|nr:ATP-binding cassette domain-containing protein [Corynebacterium silvaticum]WCV10519.1 ATP-binding cassette domain-containing protein [Corynebacterium silvaticum]